MSILHVGQINWQYMINYTDYEKQEDIKRLEFIVDIVIQIVRPGGKILDIGCGSGNISRQLGHYGFIVTGIDADNKSIAFALSKNQLSNINFICVDIYDFSGEEKDYDAIICSEVLEHLVDPAAIFKLAFSLLKNGGVFITTVPNGQGPRELLVTRPLIWIHNHGSLLWKFIVNLKRALGYKGETVQSKSEHLDHIYFFSWKKFKKMGYNTGFQIFKTGKADFINGVFPISLFMRVSKNLQNLDCLIANKLPYSWTSGFYSAWIKR